ncbi:MAG: rhodanese-like domain-containing protein [Candidatus Hodarchaeota archaeon]
MVRIIDKQELLEIIEKNQKFLLLDVRDTPDYNNEHIKAAKHLLISQIEKQITSMAEKDDLIITYSKDLNCPASDIAAETISNLGFTNILRYKGGWKEWKEANFPTDKA